MMLYEIDKYTDFLCDTGITPNQFFILWLLYTKDLVNQKKFVNSQEFRREDFEVLISKGWLINTNPQAKAYNMINLFVSPEFAERVLIEPEEAWEELFNAYPPHLIVNGNKIPAKTLTYSDTKGVQQTYTDYIKKNKFLHARVISAINVWKSNNDGYATVKIDKFVMGKYWEDIEKSGDDNRAKPSYY